MNLPGKTAEKLFTKACKDYLTERRFFYHRFPDSHAARRLIARQPADYLVVRGSHAYLIEVKELKKWPLPSQRITQAGSLTCFHMAGGTSIILIHHEGEFYAYRWERRPHGGIKKSMTRNFHDAKEFLDCL